MPVAQARKAIAALVVSGLAYLLLKSGVDASTEVKAAIEAVAAAVAVYVIPNG